MPHLNASGGMPMKIVFFALLCVASSGLAADEPVIGECEGCESVFVDMPKEIAAGARIAPIGEKGEPLVLEGTVRDADGRAAPGIIVYAYQTDAHGIYPQGSTRHGRLRGWARSDAAGHYRFETIRPAAYPGNSIPQHIHMHVIEPGKGTYYIDDVVFDDDPLLTTAQRRHMVLGRGGTGLVAPERLGGVWRVRRDIALGASVEGYPD
jgi:protocatechuate 3,4-dioxygenase beta subunit